MCPLTSLSGSPPAPSTRAEPRLTVSSRRPSSRSASRSCDHARPTASRSLHCSSSFSPDCAPSTSRRCSVATSNESCSTTSPRPPTTFEFACLATGASFR
ncbi:hypothetical protein ACFPRL_27755 [Pseudoclavibacter helvolus]